MAETTAAQRGRGGIVLFVNDGHQVEYAPELYFEESRAREEASRWMWFLGDYGQWSTRWLGTELALVGIHEIHLVPVRCPQASELWCGFEFEDSPRLAAGGTIFESFAAAALRIWGDAHVPGVKEQMDLHRVSSRVSIHRLKTVCPSQTL